MDANVLFTFCIILLLFHHSDHLLGIILHLKIWCTYSTAFIPFWGKVICFGLVCGSDTSENRFAMSVLSYLLVNHDFYLQLITTLCEIAMPTYHNMPCTLPLTNLRLGLHFIVCLFSRLFFLGVISFQSISQSLFVIYNFESLVFNVSFL